jgi:hypothetical protein
MIYEHGEPWCNDVDRGKLLIRPPELSGNPTSRVGRKQEKWAKGIMPCEVFLFILASDFYIP